MKNPIAMGPASGCPVCGQRLSATQSVCAECGAILALRDVRAPGTSTAERVQACVLSVGRRLSTLASASSTVVHGSRRRASVIVALLATMITVAAVVESFHRPRPMLDPGRRTQVELPEAKRAAALDRSNDSRRPADGARAAGPSKTDRTPSPVLGSTALGMISASVVAALLCAFALTSHRRRHHHRSIDDPGLVRARRMTQAAGVGAAFCFGLAVALAAVMVTSRVVEPPSALATVQGGGDQWRGEASTLKERLSVLDARQASLEARRAEGQAGPQPARTAAIDPDLLAHAGTTASLPMSDVLRPPRVAGGPGQSVGDRVWNDILRDLERVRRTVRDWFPRDAP